VRAVNLIPSDARRGSSPAGRSGGTVYVLLAALTIAVVLVAVYVTAANKISNEQAKVSALQAQAASAQGTATRLAPYVQFAQLAQSRAATIRGIASSRFDWHAALAGLARVIPANTSLQSLGGSVVPGVSVGGGSGASQVRTAIQAPAFQISGCSDTQDDVARLISRLRLVDGVTRVTLEDSQKSVGAQAGAAVSTTGSAAGTGAAGGLGCGANRPTFDLVVFFQPLANAGADGVISLGTPVSSTTGPAASTTGTAATATGTATTTGAATTTGTPTTTTPATTRSTTSTGTKP
jgi:Tfp pilus assembly protein PilN